MPGPAIFHRLGLFTVERFLEPDRCHDLREEVARAAVTEATVRTSDGHYAVDRRIRSVAHRGVSDQAAAFVNEKFIAVMPRIAEHFGVALESCQPPQFLSYNVGDFYKAHRDNTTSHGPSASNDRKVSAVVFLNPMSDDAGTPDSYAGGALTFFGLLGDERGDAVGLPLDATEGLLVAFRSDTIHSVAPVTRGLRYTVVSWYR